jgi:hypothetical protein
MEDKRDYVYVNEINEMLDTLINNINEEIDSLVRSDKLEYKSLVRLSSSRVTLKRVKSIIEITLDNYKK